MRAHFRLLHAVALLGALAAPAAHAGLFDDDEARKAILELRQRLDQVNEQYRVKQTEQMTAMNAQLTLQNAQLGQINEQLTQMKRSMIELNNLIELLKADNAKLRGQDEQFARDNAQLARDLAEVQRKQKDIVQGVDDRIRKIEPVKVSVDDREFLADPDEKRQYDEAMAVFRKGDFDKSAAALATFLKRYPGSGYRESALFWLGNAQYGKRDYKEAIPTFRALVAASPDHPRAAEALLSVANCQLELKDSKGARKTLDELMKGYPKSEAAQAGKERLATIKPG